MSNLIDDKILHWLHESKFKNFYDPYTETFNYDLINKEDYIWFEDGKFLQILVINKKSGAVITFRNISKDANCKWVFEEVHMDASIEVKKIINS